jgi:hypothetical protein
MSALGSNRRRERALQRPTRRRTTPHPRHRGGLPISHHGTTKPQPRTQRRRRRTQRRILQPQPAHRRQTDRLTHAWIHEHGKNPSATTMIKLRQIATLATRQAKNESPTPFNELQASWRNRARAAGQNPRTVVQHTIHRSGQRPARASDLSPAWIHAAAAVTRAGVAQRRATGNRWNLFAEAERTCADIRCHSPRRDPLFAATHVVFVHFAP